MMETIVGVVVTFIVLGIIGMIIEKKEGGSSGSEAGELKIRVKEVIEKNEETGYVYPAFAVQARGRDVLLPLLLFPILVPALLASVKATALVMQGDAMGQLGDWLKLLAAFAVIYWILCMFLFGRVVEE